MTIKPLEFLATFLPSQTRTLTRTGVRMDDIEYWDDSLEPWVGQSEQVSVHRDPRDVSIVSVRTPGGVLVKAKTTTPGVGAISLAEWQARRAYERSLARDPEIVAIADASRKRRDALVEEAKTSRRIARRNATKAAGDRYCHPPETPRDSVEVQAPEQPCKPEILNPVRTYFEVEEYSNEY